MQDFEVNLDSGKGSGSQAISSKGESKASAATNSNASVNATTANSNTIMNRIDIRRSAHPVACVFHGLFKTFALLAYV